MFDVLIVGCGITGAALAYSLSKYDVKVCVLERFNDVANGCTKANSAILHAGFDCPIGSKEARMNVLGVKLAREICKKLDVEYRDIPTFVLAFDEREKNEIRELYRRGIENGVPGIRIITWDEALRLEPELNKNIVEALYAPSSGIVNPWEYAVAMAETSVLNGVEINLNSKVKAIKKDDDGIFTVVSESGVYRSKYVVNAAGAFSSDVYAMVGGNNLIQTNYCGQYYVLDKDQGGLINSIVFPCPDEHGFKGILVAPTVHGNLIVGPDSYQVEEGDCVATVEPMLQDLKRNGHRSVPSIDFSKVIHEYAGVRPNTQIPDFVIGEAPECKNFINLAGIKSPGLSSAPAIALEAIEILQSCGLELKKKDYFVDERKVVRFRKLTREQQSELIKRNPAYGKVVCRCELITEGEILDALSRPIPPRTIDGVKRRCNAGMGRCQGGFCSPKIHELLSKKLGIGMEDILMDEIGTYIVTSKTKGE